MSLPKFLACHRALHDLAEVRRLAEEWWSHGQESSRQLRIRALLGSKAGRSQQESQSMAEALGEQLDRAVTRLRASVVEAGESVEPSVDPHPAVFALSPACRGNIYLAIRHCGALTHQPDPSYFRAEMTMLDEKLRGKAGQHRRRLLSPWWWIVDVPALIVRFPFLVLRAAGLPPKVEENIISEAIKGVLSVVLSVALAAMMAYLGLEGLAPDLAERLFGK